MWNPLVVKNQTDRIKRQRYKYYYMLPLLKDGDVILYKNRHTFGGTLFGWLIGSVCATPYFHCGIITIEDGEPYILDMMQFVGWRKVRLLDEMKSNPAIDFEFLRCREYFSKYPEFAVSIMNSLKGCSYDYSTLFRLYFTRSPFVRMFLCKKWLADDSYKSHSNRFVCSTALAYCFSGIDVDLVPNQNNWLVDPGMIARSAVFQKII